MSVIRDHVKFLRAFVQRPVETSSIAPSSRWLAARMTEGLDLDRAEVVVELGSGTGAFTRTIERQLRPDAFFLAVEINHDFAVHLAGRHPRVRVVNSSAEFLEEHLHQFGRISADCVVSSLPWAGFSDELQQRLLTPVVRCLRPRGGQLTTFAYSHAAWLPHGRQFRRLLKSSFAIVTTTPIVWRNLPPAFVYRCQR